MLIAADENIPCVGEAFSRLGEVRTFVGRSLSPGDVREADCLLVRSVTRVGRELLEGSRVRFVATATIGTDHIDEAYLASCGIGFASAQGSNAESVVEYVFAALFTLARREGFALAERTLGVVGVGNIGSRIERVGAALGMSVLACDPPLARATGDSRFRPLDELIEAADVLTFHVPLSREGPDATRHMIGERLLGRVRPGCILINTSRGAVADNRALLRALSGGGRRVGPVVIDVWENEPGIDAGLLEAAALGTSHIAGYSLDGKVNGTKAILDAACRHFGLEARWEPSEALPPSPLPRLELDATSEGDEERLLDEAVRAVYEIEADDARLRRMLSLPEGERGAHFDGLRKNYPVRREFHGTEVVLRGRASESLRAKLRALSFRVE